MQNENCSEIAPEAQSLQIDVEGARIETLAWGSPGNPGLVFLHGGGASAVWWQFIAPCFARTFRVVALSFSGAGNSSWRTGYSVETHLTEALAAARACGAAGDGQKPILVGHSYGCLPIILAAARYPEDLRAGILIEPTPHLAPNGRSREEKLPQKPRRIYSSVGEAIGRLRESPSDRDHILKHIAEQSLEPVQDGPINGWSWKHDPDLWAKMEMAPSGPYLVTARRPLAVIVGERSPYTSSPDARAYFARFMPNQVPWIEIPCAAHNIMLSEGLALAACLRSLLAIWPCPEQAFPPL